MPVRFYSQRIDGTGAAVDASSGLRVVPPVGKLVYASVQNTSTSGQFWKIIFQNPGDTADATLKADYQQHTEGPIIWTGSIELDGDQAVYGACSALVDSGDDLELVVGVEVPA